MKLSQPSRISSSKYFVNIFPPGLASKLSRQAARCFLSSSSIRHLHRRRLFLRGRGAFRRQFSTRRQSFLWLRFFPREYPSFHTGHQFITLLLENFRVFIRRLADFIKKCLV